MTLSRTKSAPSKAQLYSNSPTKRKRKAAQLASKFELRRPTGHVLVSKRRVTITTSDINDQTHQQEEHKSGRDATRPTQRIPKPISRAASHASISLPSMKLQPKRTPSSQENQNFTLQKLSHINPLHFVQSCLKAHNIPEHTYDPQQNGQEFFLKPSEEHLAAYQADAISAIRQGDIETLRSIKKSGRSLQGCNRFGESVMHLACRRGSPDTLSFLLNDNVNEGGGCCTLRVVDDYGRTPLHDACWQAEPDFKLIEIILDTEPSLLLHRDKRGHTCLDYARRETWGVWIQYLSYRMKKEIHQQWNLLNSQSE